MKNIGIVVIVLGVLTIIFGAVAGSSGVERTIGDTYAQASTSDGTTTWSCGTSDPIQVGRELREELRPQAYTEHEGAAYLRTRKRIVIVEMPHGDCIIRAEGLDRTYNNGGFAFLGYGFRPASPASGSGGNSGSWGGAK
ncbi:DUF4247 domain-containing protein [Corynebacterium sp. NPDC060344]|uniref:DUF4247 domain-containing protein n=1 Tax=Corynebacterium sp. NPDC060344 TaxID=3347101 RepID=UPI0036536B73